MSFNHQNMSFRSVSILILKVNLTLETRRNKKKQEETRRNKKKQEETRKQRVCLWKRSQPAGEVEPSRLANCGACGLWRSHLRRKQAKYNRLDKWFWLTIVQQQFTTPAR
ncbi:hypothetical protein [Thiothrix nivea]|uniref:hypothetical protein n=1 Tax=Thiothrix nivea TaxID=1031 RepID=UPI0012B68EEB|nr:hypothetical protein [Thiothrix nivea]